jgi:hypothetical protein
MSRPVITGKENMMLTPRQEEVVDRTPMHELDNGAKACIEFSVYRDAEQHTGIAVSRIEGERPTIIVQADNMQLNNVQELKDHVLAVIDHVVAHVGRPT